MEIRGISTVPVNRPAASTIEAAAPFVQPGITSTPSGTGADTPAEGKALSGGGGYISPFLRYDQAARVAVLYFRDVDTGETQSQIPSARVVEEYRRTAGRLGPAEETGGSTTRTGESSGTAGTQASGGTTTGGTTTGGATQAATPSFFASQPGTGSGEGLPEVASPSGGSFGAVSTPGFSGGGTGGLPASSGGNFGPTPGGLVSVTV